MHEIRAWKGQWLQSKSGRRKILLAAILFGCFMVAVMIPSSAHAFIDPGLAVAFTKIVGGTFAYLLSWIAIGVAKMILFVIGIIVIPILGYNDFASSTVVSTGWSLVRDTVNMFVIVILLIISIMTILGSQRANWQQQLPRLFLAVVAVNFSKTITLLFIDMGQVVMMTFSNAIRDIAAGNFVSLLSLNSYFETDPDVAWYYGSRTGTQVAEYLATAYFTLSLLMAVLVVLLMLGAAFIYRIVVLWVLIVLSPIAFFMMGVKGILPSAGGTGDKWREKLVASILLGPILVFFLWLALAVASGGPLARTEGFNTAPAPDLDSGFLTKILASQEELVSLALAMVLLMVGMQVAGQYSSQLGGIAGKLINEQSGKRLMKGVVALPGKAGLGAARFTGQQIDRRYGITKDIGNATTNIGRDLEVAGRASKLPGAGIVGGVLGIGARSLGGKISKRAGDNKSRARSAAKERVDNYSDSRLYGELRAMGDKPRAALIGIQENKEAALGRLVTDKGTQKGLLKDLESDHMENKDDEAGKAKAREAYDDIMRKAITHADKPGAGVVDDKDKAAFFKTKASHLNLLSESDIRKTVDDEDFKLGMLTPEAIRGTGKKAEAVREALKSKHSRTVYDKEGNASNVSYYDDMVAGKGIGQDLKDVISGRDSAKKIQPNPSAGIADMEAAFAAASQSDIQNAFKHGVNRVTDIPAAAANDKVANAIIDAEVESYEGMETAVRSHIATRAARRAAATGISAADKAKLNTVVYRAAGHNPGVAASALGISGSGTVSSAENKKAIENIFRTDIAEAGNAQLNSFISGTSHSDISKAIIDSGVSSKKLYDMKKEYDVDFTTPARKTVIKNAMSNIKKALESHKAMLGRAAKPNPKKIDAVEQMQDRIDALLHKMK
jgi:hypothetical protein